MTFLGEIIGGLLRVGGNGRGSKVNAELISAQLAELRGDVQRLEGRIVALDGKVDRHLGYHDGLRDRRE